ncbi:MAG: hypothetical protein IT446_11925 [Phycisphaerales bacterium]|nr:hypothetical protein [Phycisphaerales bacterium]
MNTLALTIFLAEGGWIPLVVIAVVWLITAAASATGKKTKQPPKPPIQPKDPVARLQFRINTVPPPRKSGRSKKRPAVAPPPLPAEPAVEPPSIDQSAPPAEPVARRSVPQAVSAASIHNWLTPKTLRQQFIITELFQPPVALRGEDRSM